MSEHIARTGQLRQRTAEEIRVILARRRMSAAELARRTGLKQPYVSRRMTGEIAFDLDDLEVIAAALGVTVQDLLGGAGGDSSQTTVSKVLATVGHVVRPDRMMTGRSIATPPTGGSPRALATPTTRRPARV